MLLLLLLAACLAAVRLAPSDPLVNAVFVAPPPTSMLVRCIRRIFSNSACIRMSCEFTDQNATSLWEQSCRQQEPHLPAACCSQTAGTWLCPLWHQTAACTRNRDRTSTPDPHAQTATTERQRGESDHCCRVPSLLLPAVAFLSAHHDCGCCTSASKCLFERRFTACRHRTRAGGGD